MTILADILVLALTFVGGAMTTLAFVRPKPKPKSQPVIHCRGEPGFFCYTEEGVWTYETCDHPKCSGSGDFMDSRMRMWCAHHVPDDEKQVERAVRNDASGHSDDICKVHGIECPKPWAVLEGL